MSPVACFLLPWPSLVVHVFHRIEKSTHAERCREIEKIEKVRKREDFRNDHGQIISNSDRANSGAVKTVILLNRSEEEQRHGVDIAAVIFTALQSSKATANGRNPPPADSLCRNHFTHTPRTRPTVLRRASGLGQG
jgi:hypothetical protein